MEKFKKRGEKGITLIALVITVVVLLILAGITISALSGENGILSRAGDAKQNTDRSQIIENARVDILGKQIENQGSLSESELEEILTSADYSTQGTLSDSGEESILDKTLTSKDGKYQILVREIYNGDLKAEVEEVIITYCGVEYTIQKGIKVVDWLDSQNIVYETWSSGEITANYLALADVSGWGLNKDSILNGGEILEWIPLG